MAVATVRYVRRWGDSPAVTLPEEVNDLTRAALRVWYALAHRGALASWLEFSPSRLAAEIDLCRSRMFAALKELAMKGFIIRRRAGRFTKARCVTPTKGRA